MVEILIAVTKLTKPDLQEILPPGQYVFLGGIATFGNGSSFPLEMWERSFFMDKNIPIEICLSINYDLVQILA